MIVTSKLFTLGLGVLFVVGVVACAEQVDMVRRGSRVEIHYSLEADGITVVSGDRPETMELVVGEGAYPMEYEKALVGMRQGQKKIIKLNPTQGYGAIDQALLVRVSAASLPPDIAEGTVVGSKDPNGRLMSLRVVKILDDETVVLDKNHPLAGKNLVYRVEIMKII